MAEDIMASFESQLEGANVPQESFTETLSPDKVTTPTVDSPAESLDPVEVFSKQLEGKTDVKKKATPEEEGQKYRNSTASLLGLDPSQVKTGDPAFIQALKDRDANREKPSFMKALQEGLSGAFSGDVFGEQVAAWIWRYGGAKKKLNEERVKTLSGLMDKIPDTEQVRGGFTRAKLQEIIDKDIDVENPDTVETLADVGLVALDLLTLGKGKAVTETTKQIGKQVLKAGGRTAFKRFLISVGTIGKQLAKRTGAGLSIGAATGGLQSVKGAGVDTSESIRNQKDKMGEIFLDTLKGAGWGLGLTLGLGVAGKVLGKSPAGTKTEQFIQPNLTEKVRKSEQAKGLIILKKGRDGIVDVRLPDKKLQRLGKTAKEELPGLAKLDHGTATSVTDDAITKKAKVFDEQIKDIKIENAETISGAASRKLEEESLALLEENANYVPHENIIKKSLDTFAKQLAKFKGGNLSEFWNLKKQISKVPSSLQNYEFGTGQASKDLTYELWQTKNRILVDAMEEIADSATPLIAKDGVDVKQSMKTMTDLYSIRDNLSTVGSTATPEKFWTKIRAMFIGGAAGHAGARIIR